jgi:hypothetical protein
MSELEELIDQLDDLDDQLLEPSELTDEQVDEITTRRDRLQKQVIEGIIELDDPDLARELAEKCMARTMEWLEYYTSRLRVLETVRMLKESKGELSLKEKL